MDDGSETRIVVGRELVEATLGFGFRVQGSVGPTDEPENRWGVRRSSERPEIFTCGGRLGLLYTVGREICLECVNDAPGRCRIVLHKRILIQWYKRWRFRGA